MFNFPAYKSHIKVFPALEVHFSDFYTKFFHLICLKDFTTIIHFLLDKLYHSP